MCCGRQIFKARMGMNVIGLDSDQVYICLKAQPKACESGLTDRINQLKSMGLPYCQPSMGEIKTQIIICLWFSFLHIERESAWRAIDCSVKHPLSSVRVCLPADCWQDMAHKATRRLKIHTSGCALHLFGFAARGNQTVNSFCIESQLTVCDVRA